MLSKEEIIKKVSEVSFWGQSIPLPHGIITPGKVMYNLETVKRLGLPENLNGKRILDIGTWDGFYAFECENRGGEVVAIDNLKRMERPEERQYASLKNTGFQIAKEILQSKVEYRDMDVCDISPLKIGTFDIVLFLGVFYHLKHPLLAFEKISEVTKNLLILESEWMMTCDRTPLLQYCEGDSYNQDPTNWFIPNTQCLFSMLRDVGFKHIEVLFTTPMTVKSAIKGIIKLKIRHRGRIILRAKK